MNEIKQINKFYLVVLLLTITLSGMYSSILPGISLLTSQILFLIVPSLVFIRYKKLDVIESFSLKNFRIVNLTLLLFLTILMQYPLAAASEVTAYFFGDQVSLIFGDLVGSSSFLVLFLSLAVLPSICEEMFFRGLIFSRYKNRVSMKTLILMNALLFALFHLNIQQFSYAFLFGIVVSLVVYLTDSIYSAILMHFLNNLLSVIEMKYPESYFSILNYILPKGEGIFYIGMMIILSIFSSVVIYVVLKYMAKLNGRSMIDYGVFEELESVTINFDDTPKENIIDSMKKFEAMQLIDKKLDEECSSNTNNRFLHIREVFSWHIVLAIAIFIMVSILISLASYTS